jgi:hypothetical protein
MDLNEIGYENMDHIILAQDKVKLQAAVKITEFHER